jgi:hypothetical protein
MERVSRKPMITIGIAFVNNKGKFKLKSLGTSTGGRPAGTLPQTFTCEKVTCERQTDRQTDRQTGKRERQNPREERAGKMRGKGVYPPLVKSQLPTDDSVDYNDDSWPVMIGRVLVSQRTRMRNKPGICGGGSQEKSLPRDIRSILYPFWYCYPAVKPEFALCACQVSMVFVSVCVMI